MSFILITLATFSILMVWRDLKSERIYYARRYSYFQQQSPLEYDAPENFYEKADSPFLYWATIAVIMVCCLIAFIIGGLLFFVSEDRLESNKLALWLFDIPLAVFVVYLIQGLMGRLFSWIKNYGSVDKKW